jgi:hypothetical protein
MIHGVIKVVRFYFLVRPNQVQVRLFPECRAGERRCGVDVGV